MKMTQPEWELTIGKHDVCRGRFFGGIFVNLFIESVSPIQGILLSGNNKPLGGVGISSFQYLCLSLVLFQSRAASEQNLPTARLSVMFSPLEGFAQTHPWWGDVG